MVAWHFDKQLRLCIWFSRVFVNVIIETVPPKLIYTSGRFEFKPIYAFLIEMEHASSKL